MHMLRRAVIVKVAPMTMSMMRSSAKQGMVAAKKGSGGEGGVGRVAGSRGDSETHHRAVVLCGIHKHRDRPLQAQKCVLFPVVVHCAGA